jgi:hypothetical protein
MRTRVHLSKEETRAAIEKEIASITTDLERLRSIIHRATDDQTRQTESPTPADERHTDVLVH